MLSVREKLLYKPIPTNQDFSAGGNMVPIVTKNSSQSVKGVQNMGLAASKTVLGPYRMGDDDGNAQTGAIYYDTVNVPQRPAGRVYNQVSFLNVGNSVFQPETGLSTPSLLKKLGENKYKYDINAPYADWFAAQTLARETASAARNAGLEDIGKSREIMRNLVEKRRNQSNEDYIRRMVQSGMTEDDALNEIETVRKANQLQEAKKVDDRSYQAKLLISRIAALRGITPQVNEPLDQSGAIENPQPNQVMSAMLGENAGFGSSARDVNRDFITPDFYKKFLRPTTQTQESADEQSAINRQIVQSGADMNKLYSTNGFSASTLEAKNREQEIFNSQDAVAARLESLQGSRIRLPLPKLVFARRILGPIYQAKGRKEGDLTQTSVEDINTMNLLQVLSALNALVIGKANGLEELSSQLKLVDFGRNETMLAPDTLDKLKKIALYMNVDASMNIPFANSSAVINKKELWNSIQELRNPTPAIKQEVQAARKNLAQASLQAERVPSVAPQGNDLYSSGLSNDTMEAEKKRRLIVDAVARRNQPAGYSQIRTPPVVIQQTGGEAPTLNPAMLNPPVGAEALNLGQSGITVGEGMGELTEEDRLEMIENAKKAAARRAAREAPRGGAGGPVSNLTPLPAFRSAMSLKQWQEWFRENQLPLPAIESKQRFSDAYESINPKKKGKKSKK